MKKIVIMNLIAFAGISAVSGVNEARADCSPKCKSGEVCRYESTEKPPYYCAADPKKPSSPKATGGGAVSGGASTGKAGVK